jgi:hypothetical protein
MPPYYLYGDTPTRSCFQKKGINAAAQASFLVCGKHRKEGMGAGGAFRFLSITGPKTPDPMVKRGIGSALCRGNP